MFYVEVLINSMSIEEELDNLSFLIFFEIYVTFSFHFM